MIYELTWRQWCGVFALAILAAAVVGRAAWVLMGRHEQPRDSVLRRAAARIYQAIWPAEDYGEVTDDNGEAIGDLLPDVARAGDSDGRIAELPDLATMPGSHAGPGHLHDGDLGGLDPEDAETVAQWRADHDAMAAEEELPTGGTLRDGMSGQPLLQEPAGGASPLDALPVPPRPDGKTRPEERQAGPSLIQAAIVQGQTVILDGQPSPPLDDTAFDQIQGPRAGRAAWHGPVQRPPLPAWVQDALRAATVDDALRDIWVMSQVRALAAP